MNRRAFTLVELLVVVGIIAIIATALLISVYAAQQSAKKADTIHMIKLLDRTISRQLEQYEARPFPVPLEDICGNLGLDPRSAQDLALARLMARREIQRMEMPERFTDIIDPPVVLARKTGSGYEPYRTGMSRYLAERFTTLREGRALAEIEQYESAECLYMIVSHTKEGMEAIARRDIGDADDDGFPEYHDSWGHPILFLRWAPGATSNMMPQADGTVPREQMRYSSIQEFRIVNGIARPHDPWDLFDLDADAYQMWPLIMSSGPDGKSGINFLNGFSYAAHQNDPLASVGVSGGPIGEPMYWLDPANGQDHLDNLHNHSSLVE